MSGSLLSAKVSFPCLPLNDDLTPLGTAGKEASGCPPFVPPLADGPQSACPPSTASCGLSPQSSAPEGKEHSEGDHAPGTDAPHLTARSPTLPE